MAKTHPGDCIEIDPFIPTGQCTICTGAPQDTTIPEDRPTGELALTSEDRAVPNPPEEPVLEEPVAEAPAEDPIVEGEAQ